MHQHRDLVIVRGRDEGPGRYPGLRRPSPRGAEDGEHGDDEGAKRREGGPKAGSVGIHGCVWMAAFLRGGFGGGFVAWLSLARMAAKTRRIHHQKYEAMMHQIRSQMRVRSGAFRLCLKGRNSDHTFTYIFIFVKYHFVIYTPLARHDMHGHAGGNIRMRGQYAFPLMPPRMRKAVMTKQPWGCQVSTFELLHMCAAEYSGISLNFQKIQVLKHEQQLHRILR